MKAVGNLATLDDSTQDAFYSIPAYWLNLGSEGLLQRETDAEEDQNWIWLRQHYADLKTITSAEPWRPLSVTELIHY